MACQTCRDFWMKNFLGHNINFAKIHHNMQIDPNSGKLNRRSTAKGTASLPQPSDSLISLIGPRLEVHHRLLWHAVFFLGQAVRAIFRLESEYESRMAAVTESRVA